MDNRTGKIPFFVILHFPSSTFRRLALRLCVFAFVLLSLSCASKPTDVRSVLPADALVYIETNDLGKTVGAVTQSKSFQQLAKTRPDLSELSGIKIGVAVTGFQTTEQPASEENSTLDFQPHFVAAAETNAWNFQALRFTENKLGEFINETYGGGVVLETSDRKEGKYFVWTAQDGRKAFALVRGSLIIFGNDESSIEKSLSVMRSEADSIAKNTQAVSLPADSLASGFISKDGIGQIANIAGVSLALGASEEGEVKSFIARVLPEILRNSVTEVTWTAAKTEQGIEDRYTIKTSPEIAAVFNETLAPASGADAGLAAFLPTAVSSATRYDLRDPQIAWRSVLLTAQKQTDTVSGHLIAAFSGSLFEPYGIEDPETFLSGVGPQIVTARFDKDGDNSVIIAGVKDIQRVKKGVAKEINFAKPPEKGENTEIWKSNDGEIAAAFTSGKLILGDAESVVKCLQVAGSDNLGNLFANSNAVAVTVAKDPDSAVRIIGYLTENKPADGVAAGSVFTETRFNQNGIERRTVSEFGLIGAIIDQLGNDGSETSDK